MGGERRTVSGADGLRLAVQEHHRGADETVVLVHGYPDNHRVWNPVAERLAERFHVVTYDVRGAGDSEAPESVEDYGLPLLAADFRAVLDATVPEGRTVHLVGHDWGSLQGWDFVTDARTAARIASYTSISGPHLDAVGEFMQLSGPTPPTLPTVLRQWAKSWYVGVFQIPWLAPSFWGTGFARHTWPRFLERVEGIPTAYLPSGDDLDAVQRDGANGVNLYRANMLGKVRRPRRAHTDVPVQVIVALRDRYVSRPLAECVTGVAGDLVFRQIDAGHWVVLTRPDEVAELIVEHVERNRVPATT